MKKILISTFLFLTPLAALAQVLPPAGGGASPLGLRIEALLVFVNQYLIPLIFALAFIVFLWYVFTYFIAGGAQEESQQKGRQFVLWSIIGFVLMFTVWGIINLLVNTLNLDTHARPAFPCLSGTTCASGGAP